MHTDNAIFTIHRNRNTNKLHSIFFSFIAELMTQEKKTHATFQLKTICLLAFPHVEIRDKICAKGH